LPFGVWVHTLHQRSHASKTSRDSGCTSKTSRHGAGTRKTCGAVGGDRRGSAPDLAGTWIRYQQMVAAGVGPHRSKSSSPAPRPWARASRANGEPVDISTLLYKGASARRRAQELREAAKRANGDALRAIIDEVCDLVVLAIEPE